MSFSGLRVAIRRRSFSGDVIRVSISGLIEFRNKLSPREDGVPCGGGC